MFNLFLHITFRGICAVQQCFISCPLHWKTTLRIKIKVTSLTVWNKWQRYSWHENDLNYSSKVLNYKDARIKNPIHASTAPQQWLKTIVFPKCKHVTEHRSFSIYLCLSFIYIFLLHISSNSKVCHFTRFFLSNQHITSCEVMVNDLR